MIFVIFLALKTPQKEPHQRVIGGGKFLRRQRDTVRDGTKLVADPRLSFPPLVFSLSFRDGSCTACCVAADKAEPQAPPPDPTPQPHPALHTLLHSKVRVTATFRNFAHYSLRRPVDHWGPLLEDAGGLKQGPLMARGKSALWPCCVDSAVVVFKKSLNAFDN